MDGVSDPAWHQKMGARVPEVRRAFTRGEAARTFTFWVFNVALGSQALIVTAVVFHIASLGAEQGLSRTAAFAVFLPMSLFSVASNFLAGWLSDRIRLKWLLAAMMASQATGTLGLLTLADRWGTGLFVAGYGISGGLFATITTVTWPRFFGRQYLGAVSGLNMSVMVFASAVGPVLFSAGQRWTGTYSHVIAWSVLPPLVLLGCSFKADNPQERESDQAG
jgi:cyanate permease